MSNTSNPPSNSSVEAPHNGDHASTTSTSTHDYFADTRDFAVRGMNFKMVGGTSATVHASASAHGDGTYALHTIPSQAFKFPVNQPKTMSMFTRAKGFVMQGGDFSVVGGNSVEIVSEGSRAVVPAPGEAVSMFDVPDRKAKSKVKNGRSGNKELQKAIREAKKRARKRRRRAKKSSK